jgi:hypothetical protein
MVAYQLNLPDVLTRLYPDGPEELTMEDFPAYGVFKKVDCLYEAGRELSWEVTGSPGAATTLAEAEANEAPPQYKRPFITRAYEYATATIYNDVIDATKNDKDAILDVVDTAVSKAVRGIKRSLGTHVYRDGTGVRAQLAAASSGVGTTTVTLANALDTALFEGLDWLQATGDKVNLASAGAKIQIIGRNIGAGQLIAAGNWTASIAAIADGYYLLRSGDLNAVVKGLGAWIPPTAPTAGDSFFSLDRSTIGEAAFGHRPTSSSSSLSAIFLDGLGYMHAVTGDSPDIGFVNPLDFQALTKEIGSYESIVVPAQGLNNKTMSIGYTGARFMGPNGKCELVADPMCPRGSSWVGNRETAEWWTMGSLIQQRTRGMGDGGGYVQRGIDGISMRWAGLGQFVVKKPWNWAYLALPTG